MKAESGTDKPPVLLTINGEATSKPASTAGIASPFGLSAGASEMAQKWSLMPALSRLAQLHATWKTGGRLEDAVEYLLHKQSVTEDVMMLTCDVRRCTNAIDRAIARNQEKSAYLTELRDKAIRYNTYADLVAGGLTGMLSGALELGDLSRFAFNTIDVLEGVGQSGLSLWAFKAEHTGDREQGPMPNLLSCWISPSTEQDAFPPSVRTYLKSVPPNARAGMSRGKELVDRWAKLNFCLTHKGHRSKHERAKHLAGVQKEDVTVTIDLLEDRIAMLYDLRVEVTSMDDYLAELLAIIRRY